MIAIAATLALTLAAPNLSSPADDAAIRARLAPLLGAIDRPTPLEAWKRLPPEAQPVLEAIAGDPRELPSRRAAALSGLAVLGADGTLHRRLAEDRSAPYLVRARAVRGLGTLLPATERSAALRRLLTDDPDVRIRAAAAGTLTLSSPAEGCGAVKAQSLREPLGEREGFERALAACVNR